MYFVLLVVFLHYKSNDVGNVTNSNVTNSDTARNSKSKDAGNATDSANVGNSKSKDAGNERLSNEFQIAKHLELKIQGIRTAFRRVQ